MKRMMFFIGILFVWQVTTAGNRSFAEGSDEFQPYGFQRMWRWEEIRKTYCGERNFCDMFRQTLNERKDDYLICPWWLEDLYDNSTVAACCKGGIGYVGYVLDPVSGKPLLTNEWRNQTGDCILNDAFYLRVPFDLVVYCRSGESFDRFLCSERARLNFLHQMFEWPDGMINQVHQQKRPRGIHFYLPDLTFREKRKFTQFIKSVSMVIDSMRVENGRRPYAGSQCMLYITLAARAQSELDFLSGIAVFVDQIYFVDYNECGVAETSVRTLNIGNDPAGMMTRLFNQFYLFHPGYRAGGGENGHYDIDYLAQADYDNFQWVIYFYLEVVWILIFLAIVLGYHFYSPFYMLAERYSWLVAPVVITFVTEAIILFLFIIEAISKEDILFGMNDYQYLWLLALPIVFAGLNIFFRALNHRSVLP